MWQPLRLGGSADAQQRRAKKGGDRQRCRDRYKSWQCAWGSGSGSFSSLPPPWVGSRSSHSSKRRDCRTYASTTYATPVQRCYSLAATMRSSCKSSWARLHGHNARSVLARPARNGGPDCRCYGGCLVLKRHAGLRWCTYWCSESREKTRPSSLPLCLSCK